MRFDCSCVLIASLLYPKSAETVNFHSAEKRPPGEKNFDAQRVQPGAALLAQQNLTGLS